MAVLVPGFTGSKEDFATLLDPLRSAGLTALLRTRFLRSSIAGLLGMAAGLRAEPDRVTELATTLHTGGIPCLVAFGESDNVWPVPVQRDMAARLGADVAMVPGARHSPGTENPGALLDPLLPIWRRWLATTLT